MSLRKSASALVERPAKDNEYPMRQRIAMPGWLFLPTAVLMLFTSSGAAFFRWSLLFEQRSEILRNLGDYLELEYECGSGDQPDHRTA